MKKSILILSLGALLLTGCNGSGNLDDHETPPSLSKYHTDSSSFHGVYLESLEDGQKLFALSPGNAEMPYSLNQLAILPSVPGDVTIGHEYALTYSQPKTLSYNLSTFVDFYAPETIAPVNEETMITVSGSGDFVFYLAFFESYYDGMPTVPERSLPIFVNSRIVIYRSSFKDKDSISFSNSFLLTMNENDNWSEFSKGLVTSFLGMTICGGGSDFAFDSNTVESGSLAYLKEPITVIAV